MDMTSKQLNPESSEPLLRVENLAVSFPARGPDGARGPMRRVRAVNDVSLSIYPKQTLAVVGESGCGKSVTALSILRLIPTPPGSYDAGSITWAGSGAKGDSVDLLKLADKDIRKVRGNQIAMVFQEPMTSLNPVYTIGEQIVEAVLLHQGVSTRQASDIAAQALSDVGIADAKQRLKEYPHRLSGGMRQRVMIAMALACQPRLLLADEPTTALDVTIQAQILELLRKLQKEKGMSVMLITHDLGVVAENADVVAVMYAGRVVEYGSVHDVFRSPLHPYTQGLFASMPVLGSGVHRLVTIPGNVPNPSNFPSGCAFHPRCSQVNGDATCASIVPPLLEVSPQHWVACTHAPGYAQGIATRPDVPFVRAEVLA